MRPAWLRLGEGTRGGFTKQVCLPIFSWDDVWLLLLASGLLALGWALGRRLRSHRPEKISPWLLGAAVVWLGLSLSISLLNAWRRHTERQNWVHEECDSIAHVYRLLQTLPRNERAQMRLLLLAYLDANLRTDEAEEEAVATHSQMFALTTRMVKSRLIGDRQGALLVRSLSQMISVHHRADFALKQGMAPAEWLLLASHGFLVFALIGYGLSDRERYLPLGLLLLSLTALWLTLDCNEPAGGLVRVDQRNMQELSVVLHQKEKL